MTRSAEKVMAWKYMRIIYYRILTAGWICIELFKDPGLFTLHTLFIQNHNHKLVVVGYMCSYSCPWAEKRSSQSAPLTTT